MAASTQVATGATITFSTGFFAEINNISWSGYSREAIETSHMGTTTAKTFIPALLADPGELVVDLNLDQDAKPPLNAAAETVTVTIPAGETTSQPTWAASGFMTNFEWTGPHEDKLTATATIKFTGDITVTAGT